MVSRKIVKTIGISMFLMLVLLFGVLLYLGTVKYKEKEYRGIFVKKEEGCIYNSIGYKKYIPIEKKCCRG